MAISQFRSKRKSTGGRYTSARSKKMKELGRLPTLTSINEQKVKPIKVRGGQIKVRVMSAKFVNVVDSGKAEKIEIKNVLENPANRHFVRRNILTKGTVVETGKGKVKITSRPGQDGTVNGIILK